NTIFATNEQGEIISLYEYSPFGEELKQSGKDLDFTYSGKWGVQKEEYNLYYMRERYYSSELHRFLSLDKDEGNLFKPSTLNPYAYVGNDPVNFIDPSGMVSVKFFKFVKSLVFNEDGSLNFAGIFELGKFVSQFTAIGWAADLYDLGQSILAFDWTWNGAKNILLDGVGFLPGIGDFAKGFKAGSKTIKVVDAIADTVDAFNDAGKVINRADAIVDASKAAKNLDKTADALDTTHDAGKTIKNAKRLDESLDLAAKVDKRKFTDYIFNKKYDNGKEAVFNSLGYDISNSDELVKIYTEQATRKYLSGDYKIGKLDEYGQRITIGIELHGIGESVGKISYLNSGWLVHSDNSITLTTPLAGFYKRR
ncbi:MAG: RHS repeat-associated core domain-containing protein, partial [Bacteroidota bacterium]|nr:RHS repeat-associated core domain-containing protein [Bacteroidota bacterium]